MTSLVEFSIAPVQGFVAQSRRTKDLWGSSYLLSYLAARAMHGADRHGDIVRPNVEQDAMLAWVRGGEGPPRLGSTPNHFVVRTDEDPRVVAGLIRRSFDDAWHRMAEAVWDEFVEDCERHGVGTRDMWRRQVGGCWELAWVAGEAESRALLARRKHWRTHRLPDEPGDKCTVMPDFQEISGHSKGSRGQKDFWHAVRGHDLRLEIRDDERLCAPALVKRLFTRCSTRAIGGQVDADRWPSTVFIGAVPWLRKVVERAPAEAVAYLDVVKANAPHQVVRRHVPLDEFRGAEPAEFVKLEANYYHRTFLTTRNAEIADRDTRGKLDDLLCAVNKAVDDTPSVYYAMLLADGDKLSEVVAELKAKGTGRALAAFGASVQETVTRCHGVTLYAGGDDVLAMLPVPDALACADQLAQEYRRAFVAEGGGPRATLSAAVVFAHIRMPIGGVLAEAHRLLDDVAKEGNDRDSVAVAVRKPGGDHCQWVTKWGRSYPDGREERAVDQVARLSASLVAGGQGLSASLLYHLRETLEALCGLRRWKPGASGALPSGLDLISLVQAELVDSWDGRAGGPSEVKLAELTQRVADLLLVDPTRERRQATFDALLLARFLAGGGREEDHR